MLERILKVGREEIRYLFLLLLYAVVMGPTFAFYYTASTSLFLAEFDIRFLPYGFVAGGVVTCLIWILYSQLISRKAFARRLVWGVVFQFLITALLTIAYHFWGNRYVTFSLILWLHVFVFIQSVGIYTITTKLFNQQQSQRLNGYIGTGEAIAKCIVFFSVPFFLTLLPVSQFLYLAVAGTGLGLLLSIYILWHLSHRMETSGSPAPSASERLDFQASLKNKYYLFLLILSIFPFFSAYFIDYNFLNNVQEKFETAGSIAAFLGTFLGFITLTEILIKAFISKWLISRYGILSALLVLPVLLFIVTALVAMGSLVTVVASLFFSLIALTKLITQVFQTSFVGPAFQILYQAVPVAQRSSLQSQTEGIFQSFGITLAGIVLILLSHLTSIHAIFYNYFFLVVIGGWIWLSYLVYQEYRTTLKTVFSKTTEPVTGAIRTSSLVKHYGLDKIDDPVKFRRAALLLSQVEPVVANFHLLRLLPKSAPAIQLQILEIIAQKNMLSAKKIIHFCLRQKTMEEQWDDFRHTIDKLEEAGRRSMQELSEAANSARAEDRLKVVELIVYYENYYSHKILNNLLRDEDKYVRNAALVASGKKKFRELWPHIILNLSNPDSSHAACIAVKLIGEPILEALINYYDCDKTDSRTSSILINLCAEIGGERANRYLHSKTNVPDEEKIKILSALVRMNHRVYVINLPAARQAIEMDVRMIVWLAASRLDIQGNDTNGHLLQALEQAQKEKQAMVFLHMSLMYDSTATNFFVTNFQNATEEARAYALEVLDLTVPQEHKLLILPLVYNLSPQELVTHYAEWFPQQQLSFKDRLLDIINKDYLRVDQYTKSCALYLAADLAGTENCLAAHLLHPDYMIRETAFWGLYHKDPLLLQDKVQQVPNHEWEKLQPFMENSRSANDLISVMVVWRLQQISIFKELPNATLVGVVMESEQVFLSAFDAYPFPREHQKDCLVVLEGQVHLMHNHLSYQLLERDSVYWQFDEKLLLGSDQIIIPQKDSILLVVNFNLMYELLSLHKQMVQALVEQENNKVTA